MPVTSPVDEQAALDSAKASMGRGDLAAAEALLADLTALSEASARAHHLHAELLSRQGRHSASLEQARKAYAAGPRDCASRIVLAKALLRSGAPHEAELLLARARRDAPQDDRAIDLHAVAERAAAADLDARRGSKATALARRLVRANTEGVARGHRKAGVLIASGRPAEALGVIEAAIASASDAPPEQLVGLLMLQARACEAVGDLAGAVRALEDADAWICDDEAVLSQLHALAERSGRPAAALPYAARLKTIQARRLRGVLAEDLEALRGVNFPEPVSKAAQRWAWELADQTAWDFHAWRTAADWGGRSRRLVQQWWLYAPERAQAEIMAMIEPPDLTPVRQAMSGGKGCLLVGSHFGPTLAGVQFFQACGIPFRTLGAAGREQIDWLDAPTLIPVTHNPFASVREAVSLLRSGSMIGILEDSPWGQEAFAVEHLGRSIALSSFAPKLARRHGAASFWCAPLWKGERIIIELERLPDPAAEEPEQAWFQRWCVAYLARLERLMRGDPRNIDLRKGVWSNTRPAPGRAGRLRGGHKSAPNLRPLVLARSGPAEVSEARPSEP